MGTITILPETTKNPITLMGQRAGVCWGGNVEDRRKIINGAWTVSFQDMEESWNM